MTSEGEIVSGQITALAFGGNGILRHQGFVIFVPFTVPGEQITCRIVNKKKSYATAELISINVQSENRIKPACRYFGTCGGCQLQHIPYSAQLEYKRKSVEDALQRIAHIPIQVSEIVPAQQQWAYRRHITLTLAPLNGHYTAGYIGMDNSSLIAVLDCPIFIEENNPLIEQFQSFVSQLENPSLYHGRAILLKQGTGKYIISLSVNSIPENAVEVCEKFLAKYETWQGIQISDHERKVVFGNTKAFCEVAGLSFEYSPNVFIQSHSEQSANIYSYVCNIASNMKNVLDLYCGIGITSILLAKKGIDVVGVEYNEEAIRLAKENALRNDVKVRFIQGDVKFLLKDIFKNHTSNLVIVNPPRTGMDSLVTKRLLENGPSEIVYISCLPATLARDLQPFCNKGYEIISCKVFDMFPQTAHVETVVHLKRVK